MSGSLEAFVGTLTLSELAGHSGKSVEQIIDWAMGSRGRAAQAAIEFAPEVVAQAKPSNSSSNGNGNGNGSNDSSNDDSNSGVNTRTPDGRAAYDTAVLDLLGAATKPIGASGLRKEVGGTPLQMRTALNRLIGTGKVSYEGQARAMVYTVR